MNDMNDMNDKENESISKALEEALKALRQKPSRYLRGILINLNWI